MATGTIEGRNIVKLWENQNPSQAFAAQTIMLPLNDCDEFIVSVRESASSAQQVAGIKIPVGGIGCINFVGGSQGMQSGELVQWSKLITATTQTSVTFGDSKAIGRITTTNNDVCIPTEIIGIKL